MDGAGMGLEHTPQPIVARTGARFVPGRVGSSRENIIVIACVNAAWGEGGNAIHMQSERETPKSLTSYGTDEGPDNAIQNQNQNSLLVKRQNDNTSPGDWPRKISP